MQRSPLSPLLVALLCLCAWPLAGCGQTAPPPKGPDWLEEEDEEEEPEAPKPFVSPLDSYGNLKGLGKTIYGFERPHASREADHRSKVPVYYLMANEERMLRFFRSRGHVVIETSTGWRFEHSDRTLQALGDPEKAETVKDATIYAKQGPGAGWTLIYDDGKPIETAKLPLIKLLEQTTSTSAADSKTAAVAGGQPAKTGAGSGAGLLTGSSLRKLERAALQRNINRRRAKDVSVRIYKHVKKRGGRFLD